MSSINKKPLVPKMRFPEFLDSGEWKEKLVEDFFLVGSSKRVLQEDWTTQGVPFYRTRELVSLSKNEPFSSEIFISEKLFYEITQKYGLPTEGDFLVSGVGTLGISYQVQAGDRFYFKDGNVLWFKIKEGIVSRFFNYTYQSDLVQNQIIGQASKSTVGTYTIQNAKKTKFFWPANTNEQQKIADCLTSLDELIIVETGKLEAYKAHKKGLMQKLFPAEGETVPEWRFPEFRGNGEWGWSIKPLLEIGEIVTGCTPSTTDKENYGGDKLFISPADISDHRFVSQTKTTLSAKGFLKTRNIPAQSILFVCIGSTIGKIAQTAYEAATNQQINAVVPFAEYVSAFVYYALELNSSKISQIAGRQAVPIINKTLFSTVLLNIPSKEEQLKIADCLSSFDELIAAQNQKIDALKAHKKALMQGLFPSDERVEG